MRAATRALAAAAAPSAPLPASGAGLRVPHCTPAMAAAPATPAPAPSASGHQRTGKVFAARRLRAEHFQGRLVDDRAIDARLATGVRAQQRAVAQQVDAARHAARELVDAPQRRAVEGQHGAQAGDREPVRDVLHRLLLGQRLEVEARDHALAELLELGLREHAAQLGLADQHDLQQLALVRLQVGQQPQLLQHVGREVLRLVDDQQVVLPD